MKINEIVEAGILGGLKTIGKAVGTGLAKTGMAALTTLDKVGGGTGQVGRNADAIDHQRAALAARVDALTSSLPPDYNRVLDDIKLVQEVPVVYQYGKDRYHLNGRDKWAKFPGEKEVGGTVAALLDQAASRDVDNNI